jgi:hypothetical protein
MSTNLQKEKVRKLFEKLSAIGESYFDKNSRTGALNFAAVGLALTDISSNGEDVAALAYAAFEDLNYHDVCAFLSYVFKSFNSPESSEEAEEWLSNLERIEKIINARGTMRVFTKWNDATMKYDTAICRLIVKIEKVEDDPQNLESSPA